MKVNCMNIDEKILNRIIDLIKFGNEILNTAELVTRSTGFRVVTPFQSRNPLKPVQERKVNSTKAIQWRTSCLHFLQRIFGEDFHVKNFDNATKSQTFNAVRQGIGVLNAAKDDYENGYLLNVRTLIEAEVFDDFLEQSEHLLSQGYFTAAAVIAGSVLEDGLRKLCIKTGITLSAKPKLDAMNSELTKANVYNLLKQKQITAWADLRNKAAHGQGGFTKEDVEDMIRNVRRFMEDYFS